MIIGNTSIHTNIEKTLNDVLKPMEKKTKTELGKMLSPQDSKKSP